VLWVKCLEAAARTSVDPSQPVADYVAQLEVGRLARSISTLDPYSAGLALTRAPGARDLAVNSRIRFAPSDVAAA
jgi:hypothetical protein